MISSKFQGRPNRNIMPLVPPVHPHPSASLCARIRTIAPGGRQLWPRLALACGLLHGPTRGGSCRNLLIHAEASHLHAFRCSRGPGQPGSARMQPLARQSRLPNRHRRNSGRPDPRAAATSAIRDPSGAKARPCSSQVLPPSDFNVNLIKAKDLSHVVLYANKMQWTLMKRLYENS